MSFARLDDIELSLACKNTSKCIWCISSDKQFIKGLSEKELHASKAFILALELMKEYSKIHGATTCDHENLERKNSLLITNAIAKIIQEESNNSTNLIETIFSIMNNPKYRGITESFLGKIPKQKIYSLRSLT